MAAIALCGTWHNVAFCDKHLNPLGKTYSWNYIAPSESCAAMREDPELTNMLYQRTGCMPHTSYPRQALLYLKANGETLAGKQFISQGGYTFYLLTGEYCDSVSTVCGTGLMNVHTLKYDDVMLQLVGIHEEQLPRVATYHDTCPLTQRGADLLGVPAADVLLMDEATSALDPISTSKIEDLAVELKKEYTIVMVTHNMQQAARISDKTAFFLLGELVEFDNTEQLFSMPKDKRTEDYITGRFG